MTPLIERLAATLGGAKPRFDVALVVIAGIASHHVTRWQDERRTQVDDAVLRRLAAAEDYIEKARMRDELERKR